MHNEELVERGHQARDLAEYYGQLLAEQMSSGVSMQRFAALAGVSACTLYAWKRRLAAGGLEAKGGGSEFIAVDVVGRDARTSVADAYEIAFPSGASLRVPHDFDAARVSELISVLRAC